MMNSSEYTYISYVAHMLDEAMNDKVLEARDNGKGEIDYENPSDMELYQAISFAKHEQDGNFKSYYGKSVDFNKFSDKAKEKLISLFLNTNNEKYNRILNDIAYSGWHEYEQLNNLVQPLVYEIHYLFGFDIEFIENAINKDPRIREIKYDDFDSEQPEKQSHDDIEREYMERFKLTYRDIRDSIDKDGYIPVLVFNFDSGSNNEYDDAPTDEEYETYKMITPYYKSKDNTRVMRGYCYGISIKNEKRRLQIISNNEKFSLIQSFQNDIVIWNDKTSNVLPDEPSKAMNAIQPIVNADIVKEFKSRNTLAKRNNTISGKNKFPVYDIGNASDITKYVSNYAGIFSKKFIESALLNSEEYKKYQEKTQREQWKQAKAAAFKKINPDFYAAWLIPDPELCTDERDQMEKTRSEQAYTKDELVQWLRDNHLDGDISLQPVRYHYKDGQYTAMPEDGQKTVDEYFGEDALKRQSVKSYRVNAVVRLEPRSEQEQRRIERMITDVVARMHARDAYKRYNHSGRRQQLDAMKTAAEKKESKDRSMRREAARDAVAKRFFPDVFDLWKHGKNSDIRKAAYSELARLLDFSKPVSGNTEAAKAALEARALYDRYDKDRMSAAEDFANAKNDTDRQNAAIRYNEICRRFWAETANSNELVELMALDSGEFDEKSYEQLVADMQRFHGRNKDMEESEYIEYLSHMFDESFCSQL